MSPDKRDAEYTAVSLMLASQKGCRFMTLREHFAGLAMQELCEHIENHAECATEAVAYADALIAELAKDKP